MMVAVFLYRFINDSHIFLKNVQNIGDSEKRYIFATNMTSHASHTNSAPGEVFEFLYTFASVMTSDG